MRWIATLAVVITVGCSAETDAPIPIEPGTYRLEVVTDNTLEPYSLYLALEPDGSYRGQLDRALGSCRGTLAADEMGALTTALEDADALRRTGGASRCFDCGTRNVTLEVVRGPRAGIRSTFRWDWGAGTDDPAIGALELAIVAILEARAAVDDCTGCRRPIYPMTYCEIDGSGAPRVCDDAIERECDESAAGDIALCSYGDELECVPEEGWVPPIVWRADAAELWRGMSDGTPLAVLRVSITAENHGHATASLALPTWWRLEDPVDRSEVHLVSGELSSIPPGPSVTEVLAHATHPEGELATASALQLRLRERPSDTAPFRDPIPVTITDAM